MMRSDPAEQWFVTHGVRQRHLEDSVPLSQLGQVEEKATVKFAESRSSWPGSDRIINIPSVCWQQTCFIASLLFSSVFLKIGIKPHGHWWMDCELLTQWNVTRRTITAQHGVGQRSQCWVNNLPEYTKTHTGSHSCMSRSCAPTARHAGANTDMYTTTCTQPNMDHIHACTHNLSQCMTKACKIDSNRSPDRKITVPQGWMLKLNCWLAQRKDQQMLHL